MMQQVARRTATIRRIYSVKQGQQVMVVGSLSELETNSYPERAYTAYRPPLTGRDSGQSMGAIPSNSVNVSEILGIGRPYLKTESSQQSLIPPITISSPDSETTDNSLNPSSVSRETSIPELDPHEKESTRNQKTTSVTQEASSRPIVQQARPNVSLPPSSSEASKDPVSQVFAATLNSPPSQWDAWELPELSAEPLDININFGSQDLDKPPDRPPGYSSHVPELPELDSGNSVAKDSKGSYPVIADSPTPRPQTDAPGVDSTTSSSDGRASAVDQTDNAPRLSYNTRGLFSRQIAESANHPLDQKPGTASLTSPSAANPASTRDLSDYSKPSSVWSSDTTFTTASSASSASIQAQMLASSAPLRRKPITTSKTHDFTGITREGSDLIPEGKIAMMPSSEGVTPIHNSSCDEKISVPEAREGMIPIHPPDSEGKVAVKDHAAEKIVVAPAIDRMIAIRGARHESSNPVRRALLHVARTHAASLPSPAPPTLDVGSDFDVHRVDQDGCPPLVSAVSHGLGGMVESILAKGGQKESVDTRTKRTALIEASEKGHSTIVELLLDFGCSTTPLDSTGMSALHHAAQKGYLPIAKALLDRGATVDIPGYNAVTPLYLATWAPHANMVMLLLQRKADVNVRDAWQRTALHVAASLGFTNICQLLVDHGAVLQPRDGNSKTPIQLAISGGHVEAMKLILSRSNLRSKDPGFLTAMFMAIEMGHIQMAQIFLDKLEKGATLNKLNKDEAFKPITLAAKSGNPEMIELMIKYKAKIKEKDSNGWTALHYAAHHGHARIVERLADHEISTTASTTKKETSLHLAVKASSFPVVDALLRGKGSSRITAKDIHGQEPLHHAVRVADLDVLNLFFSHKAPLSNDNAFGWKPLHIAVAYGNASVVTQLVNFGASLEDRLSTTDLKKSDTHSFVGSGYWAEARWPFPGSKPLHLAIEYRRDDIARFLISRGAKPDSTCGEGWRPLHHAAFNNSPAMVEHLLSVGAYPHAVTDTMHQRTPLDIARYKPPLPPSMPGVGDTAATEEDRQKVDDMLFAAMVTTPKKPQEVWRKQMKILSGKGPEEKAELLRAADVSGEVVSVRRGSDARQQVLAPRPQLALTK